MSGESLYIKKLESKIKQLESKTEELESKTEELVLRTKELEYKTEELELRTEELNNTICVPVCNYSGNTNYMIPLICDELIFSNNGGDNESYNTLNHNTNIYQFNIGPSYGYLLPKLKLLKVKKLTFTNITHSRDYGLKNLPKHVEEVVFNCISQEFINLFFTNQSTNYPSLHTITLNSNPSFLTNDLLNLMTVKQIKIPNTISCNLVSDKIVRF
jgi:hypothetical protein